MGSVGVGVVGANGWIVVELEKDDGVMLLRWWSEVLVVLVAVDLEGQIVC